MPGLVIHLAVAEEYLKFSKKKENYQEFVKGVVAPDLDTNKSLSHFGESSSRTRLDNFLEQRDLSTSFNRGYFLHLVTDYVFYNKVIDTFSKKIYDDYDILNEYLIKKYNVKVPKKLSHWVKFKNDDLTILSKEKVEECIRMCSSMELDEIEEEVRNPKYRDKWLRIRELKVCDER